jgi:hypothetical protein
VDPHEDRNTIFTGRKIRGLSMRGIDIEEQTIFAAENLTLIALNTAEATRKLRAE